MKKLFIVLLATVMCVTAFTGCGKSSSATPSVSSEAASSAPASSVESSTDNSVLPEKFVLGLDAQFPPMGFTNQNNEIIGVDIDLAKAVCEKMGISFEAKPISWDSKEMELNAGKINCIWNGFTMTADNKEAFAWSRPYMKNTQVIVVMGDSTIASKADLAGKIVATQKASSGLSALQKDEICVSIKDGTPKEYEDYVTALTDMEIGRCDAIIMDSIVANYYITQNAKNMKVLEDTMGTEDYGIAFAKENTKLCDAVEKAMSELAAEGKIKEISQKWFGVDNMILTY